MTKRAMVLAAVLLGACQATGGTPTREHYIVDSREPVRWFQTASHIRRCDSKPVTAAFWAALAASLGALDYISGAPRSLAAGARGRRRVAELMRAGYGGEISSNISASCRASASAARSAYRQLSRSDRKLVRGLLVNLLKTDSHGRRFLQRARLVPRTRRMRRANARRAPTARRVPLKPSEQQLPIRN